MTIYAKCIKIIVWLVETTGAKHITQHEKTQQSFILLEGRGWIQFCNVSSLLSLDLHVVLLWHVWSNVLQFCLIFTTAIGQAKNCAVVSECYRVFVQVLCFWYSKSYVFLSLNDHVIVSLKLKFSLVTIPTGNDVFPVAHSWRGRLIEEELWGSSHWFLKHSGAGTTLSHHLAWMEVCWTLIVRKHLATQSHPMMKSARSTKADLEQLIE